MVVRSTHLRKLFSNFVKRALPQIAGKCKHVGFVYEREMFTLALCSKLECITHTSLYAMCSVDTALSCNFKRRSLAQHTTFTNIWAFGVFTNDNKIVRLRVARCNARKWSLVDVQIKFETHLQQQSALDYARWHSRCTNRTKQDRVKAAQFGKRGVRQHFAIAQVTRTA